MKRDLQNHSATHKRKRGRIAMIAFALAMMLIASPFMAYMSDVNIAYAADDLTLDSPYLGAFPKNVLKEKIVWMDTTSGTGNTTVTGGVELGNGNLQVNVGTTFTMQVTDDYIVTAEVTKLEPFDATEIYKARVEGTGDEASYRQNAVNSNQMQNENRNITMQAQWEKWSNIRKSGFSTGDQRTTFTALPISNNVGITWKLSAMYKGVPVKPNLVMADSEEAGTREANIFVTEGQPWELLGNVAQDGYTTPIKVVAESDLTQIAGVTPASGQPYLPKYWVNPDQVNGGLGTKIFGPVATDQKLYGVPILLTRETTGVSMYFNSIGSQSCMLGFVVLDEGDAIESYGQAIHLINPNSGNTEQPFLGDVKADLDQVELQTVSAWETDDISNAADEGARQLIGDVVDSLPGQTYPNHTADNNTYTIEVLASNGGYKEAYIKGWVDFNNNGVFEPEEVSETVTVDANDKYELVFNDVEQLINTDVDLLGTRVRIAALESDIATPNGVAFSGEVEDFLIPVVHSPRGEKTETTDIQGAKQTATLNFHAYGMNLATFVTDSNAISPNEPLKIVKDDGTLVDEYTEAGVGTYRIEADGKISFQPLPSFVGQAHGVVVRAMDLNANTTGWTADTAKNGLANVNDGVNTQTTMDAVYIPTVTAVSPSGNEVETTGFKGDPQKGKVEFTPGHENVPMDSSIPATFVGGKTEIKIAGEGTYTVAPDGTVTFVPDPEFVGRGTTMEVVRVDVNGVSAIGKYTATVKERPVVVDTGDSNKQLPLILIAGAAIIALVIIVVLRKLRKG